MESRFHMQHCRFHVVEKDQLLICGSWDHRYRNDGDIVVSFDYTPAEVEGRKQKTVRTPEAYIQLGECEERYFFWATVPDNYRDYKKIRVFERKQLQLTEIFSADTAWLDRLRDRIPMAVDDVLSREDGVMVRGWCIAREDYEVKVYDSRGREVPSSMTAQRRPDVELAYPECERGWIHGYVVKTDRKIPGRMKIVVRCDGREETVKRLSSQPAPVKAYNKAKETGRKARVYYQQFGFRKTVKRGMEKLLQKEAGTYERFRLKYLPNRRDLERQRKERFAYEPEFAVVVPLYRTPLPYLEDLIRSIQAQTYKNWKLYLADGSGEGSPLTDALKDYAAKDARIRVVASKCPLHISGNTNQALRQVEEEYIVFADHDDMLAPDALYECVKALNRLPETEVIYTDEDKVSMDGKEYYQPHFKPDFNLDLLRSANYMCHLYVVKKSLFDRVGYLDPKYDGSQDYDFILRCVEQTEHIVHIPKILYHWRMHPGSVAGDPASKSYAYEAGRNAIQAHYKRVGIEADITFVSPGFYRSIYRMTEEPLVSVIIPNKDHREDLEECIESVQKDSTYRNFEIVIVENNSEGEDIWEYYKEAVQKYDNIRILYYKGTFNYSAIHNFAVQRVEGEYLLFLNNDTRLGKEDSIREMLSYCMRRDVGIVGARLLYPDDTVQHAGVIVGLGGVAGHAFLGAHRNDPGYFNRIICVQDYSAVTAACMMVKKSVYNEVEGMDTELQVAFNDTDFCLRVREKGYRIIYQPFAVWYHDESKTRGAEDTEEKVERFGREIEYFQRRWKRFLKNGDPNYNPNLALDGHDFALRR